MKFECSRLLGNKKETWIGEITSCTTYKNSMDIYVQSRSSFHIIIGKSKYGNYVCVPNFNSGCYLSTLDDIFWNTEKLVNLIGEVDGITVAKAIKHIGDNLTLAPFFCLLMCIFNIKVKSQIN
ncbi:hypothetical protein KPL42_18245 [Clostridium gasigenes]|uniref:DUF6618 family protein n=1 Tax=Clostridium gasigenes TaxID=94869 RepID=UPI001C0ACF9C|nr:DUF6618 family protein [Clostridium gasigenes]MBU3090411.1 hypothetical protein [Clostridium gasigenes]